MYLEILDSERQKLLLEIGSQNFLKDFYMAGGTALSLQLGLRISVDFDFFTPLKFDPDALFNELKKFFLDRVKYKQSTNNLASLDVEIDGVDVSFLQYLYPLIKEPFVDENFNRITLANIDDILCMKVVAINQRGLKKDFYDFAVTCKKFEYGPEHICDVVLEKFKENGVLSALMFSLTFFDDAEESVLPELFIKYSWEEVKTFCLQFAGNLRKYLANRNK